MILKRKREAKELKLAGRNRSPSLSDINVPKSESNSKTNTEPTTRKRGLSINDEIEITTEKQIQREEKGKISTKISETKKKETKQEENSQSTPAEGGRLRQWKV